MVKLYIQIFFSIKTLRQGHIYKNNLFKSIHLAKDIFHLYRIYFQNSFQKCFLVRTTLFYQVLNGHVTIQINFFQFLLSKILHEYLIFNQNFSSYIKFLCLSYFCLCFECKSENFNFRPKLNVINCRRYLSMLEAIQKRKKSEYMERLPVY